VHKIKTKMSTLNRDVFYIVEDLEQAIYVLQRMKQVIEMNATRSTEEISEVLRETIPFAETDAPEVVSRANDTLKYLLRNPKKLSERYSNYAINQSRLRNISDYASSLGLNDPYTQVKEELERRRTMRGGKPKSRKTSRRK